MKDIFMQSWFLRLLAMQMLCRKVKVMQCSDSSEAAFSFCEYLVIKVYLFVFFLYPENE